MEAIGAASAIAGLLSLSGGILAKGYTFLASVHRAPQELRDLLCEAAALNSVLNQLQALNEDDQSLLLVQTSIQKCQQIECQELRNLGKRVKWPFKEKETKEALSRLGRIRGHLTTALTADMA
ncbi:hypothetical protein Daus18300_000703 [Diaporthe australafricana]|uniref:Azaphilone pigments biosynthesis cluster protein L N-terminal domain-containing protein n=1 Tax=Diaporthe australafricana TaxID=127596 RepID=A0ABR3Y2V7_9PEZI